MIKRPFVPYIFFHFTLVCVALLNTAHAAQMIINDKELVQHYSAFNALFDVSQNKKADNVPSHSFQAPVRKKIVASDEIEEKNPANVIKNISDLLTTDPDEASLVLNKVIQPNNQRIELIAGDPYDIIKQAAKQLLNENSENELLQNSLIALSLAKQQIDEVEEIINELARELMASMEPEELIFSNMMAFQQENISTSISGIDESVIQTYNSQTAVENFSDGQKQSLENYDSHENGSIFGRLLKKIFRINTLFYLFGIILLFPVILRLFRFLLFGKYKESFGD